MSASWTVSCLVASLEVGQDEMLVSTGECVSIKAHAQSCPTKPSLKLFGQVAKLRPPVLLSF